MKLPLWYNLRAHQANESSILIIHSFFNVFFSPETFHAKSSWGAKSHIFRLQSSARNKPFISVNEKPCPKKSRRIEQLSFIVESGDQRRVRNHCKCCSDVGGRGRGWGITWRRNFLNMYVGAEWHGYSKQRRVLAWHFFFYTDNLKFLWMLLRVHNSSSPSARLCIKCCWIMRENTAGLLST